MLLRVVVENHTFSVCTVKCFCVCIQRSGGPVAGPGGSWGASRPGGCQEPADHQQRQDETGAERNWGWDPVPAQLHRGKPRGQWGAHPSVGGFQNQSRRNQGLHNLILYIILQASFPSIRKIPFDYLPTQAGLTCRPKWWWQRRQRRTLTPPVWSTCRWLCARRSSSSAYPTCPMLTRCTSTLWSGSFASSCRALPTLREQVQRNHTLKYSFSGCILRILPVQMETLEN